MKIELDVSKSVYENANAYYERAKKAKKKLLGAKRIVEQTRKKLDKLKREREQTIRELEQKHQQSTTMQTRKDWYERFRWFYTSKGHLAIGGRDATTNELVIKKHTDASDLVFHTDMAGSPFFVLKLAEGVRATKQEIAEMGSATVLFSRAFKLGFASAQVFYVHPDQVSKEANPGEYLAKGAFMIRGRTTYVTDLTMELALTLRDGKLMAAPFLSLSDFSQPFVIVVQGAKKPSDLAKQIKARIGYANLDDIIAKLPAGYAELLDERATKERVLGRNAQSTSSHV